MVSLPWHAFASSSLIADGFDYPVGKPSGEGYYDAQNFGEKNYQFGGKYHLGEDWNGKCGGRDCDLNDSVFAVANGEVKTKGFYDGWGGVVIIEHLMPNGTKIYSQYGHLNDIQVSVGDQVKRGDKLGGMSKGDQSQYPAHLHFEIRTDENPKKLDPWLGYSSTPKPTGWVDPSDFINSHRPLPKAVLTVSEATDTTAKVSWTKTDIKNFSKYEIYRSTEVGGTNDPEKRTIITAIINADTLEFIDTGLSPSTNYFYSIFAYDNYGNFSQSDEVSATTQTGIKNITRNPYHQDFPSMTDKYVVWNDGRIIDGIPSTSLYVYNIEKDEIKTYSVGLSGSANVTNPSIYGSQVFYEGVEGFPRGWAQNVYIIDIETYGGSGSGFMVDATSKNYLVFPDIYKNIVVWSEYKSGTLQDIYYLDLDNGWQGPVPIAEDAGAQLDPDIWERKIVYRDAAATNTKIILADIDTKEKNVLFEGRLASAPTIDQGMVSWVYNNTLYYYDIETKTTKTLANTKVSHAITKEKKLIYFVWGAEYSPGSIHVYDTATNKDTEVVKGLIYSSNFDYANGMLTYTAHSEFDNSAWSDIFLLKVH